MMVLEQDKRLHIRISATEYELLSPYCEETMRTQSDVITELLRTLKVKSQQVLHISVPTICRYPSSPYFVEGGDSRDSVDKERFCGMP